KRTKSKSQGKNHTWCQKTLHDRILNLTRPAFEFHISPARIKGNPAPIIRAELFFAVCRGIRRNSVQLAEKEEGGASFAPAREYAGRETYAHLFLVFVFWQ